MYVLITVWRVYFAGEIFAYTSYLCIAWIFRQSNFCQDGKGRCIFTVHNIMEKKICGLNFRQ